MTRRRQQTFYRYRSFSEATLHLLCHDSLHFANPSTFNDPLDCKPILKADSSLEDLRDLLAHLVKQRVKTEVVESLAQAQIKREKAEAYAQNHANIEASRLLHDIAHRSAYPDMFFDEEPVSLDEIQLEISLLTDGIQSELARFYTSGVCCFSSTYSNPLLWSHYGDQHRGLCIGYDLNRKPKPLLYKVIYGGSRCIQTSTLIAVLLKDDQDAKKNLDRDMLLRKASGWGYEREWRLLGKQGVQDSPLRLKELTFGLRCPNSVIHTVISALHNRRQPLKYYKVYSVNDSFRFARRELYSDESRAFLPRTALSAEEVFGDIL